MLLEIKEPSESDSVFKKGFGIMFDTNVFNKLLDRGIDCLPVLGSYSIFVTSIQWKELSNTRSEKRRKALQSEFLGAGPVQVSGRNPLWSLEYREDGGKALRRSIYNELEKVKSKKSNAYDTVEASTKGKR